MVVTEPITEETRLKQFDKYVMPHVPLDMRIWLECNGFFTQAASTRFHGAYAGGLFDHSYRVMMNLMKLTGRLDLEWKRPESPIIVGMFHDLCKIDQYKLENGKYVWVRDTEIKGHGDKSAILLSRLMQITDEEFACVRYHMGAFSEKDEWQQYTDAIHEYPNVLWTHTADMMASHLDGV